MKFLINKGFSEKFIEELSQKYDESVLDIISLERYNVEKLIDYFYSIGISNIDSLMLYRIELFTKDADEIKQLFENYGVLRVVKLINEDVVNIDLV